MSIELARRLEPQTISEMRALAQDAVSSRFFAVRSPEEALVILMTGHELGLRPMQSLRGIYVVNGKPVLSADMLVGAVLASGACTKWRVVVTTPERCEIHTRRKGQDADEIGVWTRADAETAGLTRKGGTWAQYPAIMLRHRCAADLARRVYPDVCLGVYVPGELDGGEGGGVIELPRAVVTSAAPAEQVVEATPVTALDYLRDDLASAETLDAVRAAWADHQRAVTAMDEDEVFQGALHTAREMVNARIMKLGLATSPTGADALMKAGDEPELLADFRLAIDVTGESDAPARAIVVAYVAWRDRLEKLPKPWPAQAKRYAIQAYSSALAVDEKEGAKQLAAAIKKHDAPPPDGSDPKAAKPRAVAPASDAKGEGGESSGAPANTQARAPHPESAPYVADAAAWRARCVRYTNAIEARRSWEKHVPAFRAAGVFSARRHVATLRLQALASILDETVAQRVLDDAERAADSAARVRAEAQRTRRSEITVRRQTRERNERAAARELVEQLPRVAGWR